jgi:hypothetical protein
LIRELIKSGEGNITIELPFYCDYGWNIIVGEYFYANFNIIFIKMALSVFSEKGKIPQEEDLIAALGTNFRNWKDLNEFVIQNYPQAIEQWNFGGEKYGWGLRLRDKKRVIVYLIPCDGYFKIGLVYGEKATNDAKKSNLSAAILSIIENAPVYAEGRGFRIDINDSTYLEDLFKLILIKLKY